tara:strand:- start:526 stop:765 length:240 start_codon:yes stop_codon:yes gene_type:complete
MKDKTITLPNGEYIYIKFEEWGLVYDRFDSEGEHLESYGYDNWDDLEESDSSNYMVDMPFFKETMDHLDKLTIRGERND